MTVPTWTHLFTMDVNPRTIWVFHSLWCLVWPPWENRFCLSEYLGMGCRPTWMLNNSTTTNSDSLLTWTTNPFLMSGPSSHYNIAWMKLNFADINFFVCFFGFIKGYTNVFEFKTRIKGMKNIIKWCLKTLIFDGMLCLVRNKWMNIKQSTITE